MDVRTFSLAAIGTTLALSICSSKSRRDIVTESPAPATNGGKGIKPLNVSYDVAHDFYKEYNPLFAKEYQAKHSGEAVDIQQSHGGSSEQALSAADGLAADVVTTNQTSDIELLEQKGLIEPDWAKRLPNDVVPYASTTVFLVHEDNSKQTKGQPDLTKNGVQIVIANPKTTDSGHYAFLGACDYGLKANNGDENKAEEFIAALLKNAPVFENGGHAATTTFSQCNIGDILVTFENETNHVSKRLAPNRFEIVYPSYTILSESPVAAVDSVVEKKGTHAAVEECLQYLWSKPAQEPAAKLYLRPRDAKILAAHKAGFPEIETFSSNEKFSPWKGIMKKHFSSGGLVDQLSPKK